MLLCFSPPDINECNVTDISPCDGNATCTNTNGSYICTCFEGYTGDGLFCTRKNLLFLEEICWHSRVYIFVNNLICEHILFLKLCFAAITHCGLGDNCDVNAQCVETNDGFVCQCNRGYEGDRVNCCELCLIECICYDALLLQNISHSVMKYNLVACFSLYILHLQLLVLILKVCVPFWLRV